MQSWVRKRQAASAMAAGLLSLILFTVGCGSTPRQAGSSSTGSQTGGSSASGTITLQLSDDFPSNHPQNVAWQKWIDEVKKDTGGHVVINLYPNGELYNGANAAQAVASGNLAMAALSTPTIVGLVPDFDVLSLPYIAPTVAQAVGLTSPDLPLFQLLAKEVAPKNIVLLQSPMWEAGTFPIIVRAKRITSLTDLKGLKIRTLGGQTLNDTVNSLGASPIQLAPADVPMALQTGTIDAAIGSFQWFDSTLSDSAKGAIDTGAVATLGYFVVVNNATWEKIPSQYRQTMVKDLQDTNKQWTDNLAKVDDKTIGHLKSTGHWIYSLSTADEALLQTVTRPIWQAFQAKHPDAYDALLASRQKLGLK